MLTWPEVWTAALVGMMRQLAALKDGRRVQHGFEGDGWDAHIVGAIGELAFCKANHRYWMPTLNTFRMVADVGLEIEVRARTRHEYELIHRPDDDPEHAFVLVTGKPPTLIVRGWAWGRDCRRDEWWKDHGKRPHAWFVPHDALQDMSGFEHALLAKGGDHGG